MSTIEINRLDAKYTEKIIEIISSAFENYPLTQYLFSDGYKQSTKYLIKLKCDEKSKNNNLILGAFAQGKLQGVAFVTPPGKAENNNDVDSTTTSTEEEFVRVIGKEAIMRLEAYSNIKKANKPPQPHFYIDILAVNPESQGKGIGRALLSKVHQISEQDSESYGVALDTHTQENVDYYKRCGYEVSAEVQLENLQNRFLFRPNMG